MTYPLLYQVSRYGRSNQGRMSYFNQKWISQNRWGTASWRIMEDTNEAEQWEGLHVTPGRKDDKPPFRSEIGGIYAMAVVIKLICKFFHVSNGVVSFGSDCQAALDYIFDPKKLPQQQQTLSI
jgi:hypothetical protein